MTKTLSNTRPLPAAFAALAPFVAALGYLLHGAAGARYLLAIVTVAASELTIWLLWRAIASNAAFAR